MKEIALSDSNLVNEKTTKSKTDSLKSIWLLILYFCGFGGIFLACSGLIMSGLAYFRFVEKDLNLHKTGTILIVLAFPLIMFGAHALDNIGKLKRGKSV